MCDPAFQIARCNPCIPCPCLALTNKTCSTGVTEREEDDDDDDDDDDEDEDDLLVVGRTFRVVLVVVVVVVPVLVGVYCCRTACACRA